MLDYKDDSIVHQRNVASAKFENISSELFSLSLEEKKTVKRLWKREFAFYILSVNTFFVLANGKSFTWVMVKLHLAGSLAGKVFQRYYNNTNWFSFRPNTRTLFEGSGVKWSKYATNYIKSALTAGFEVIYGCLRSVVPFSGPISWEFLQFSSFFLLSGITTSPFFGSPSKTININKTLMPKIVKVDRK